MMATPGAETRSSVIGARLKLLPIGAWKLLAGHCSQAAQ